MNTAKQIEDIIDKLANLQLQQDELLIELRDLSKRNTSNSEDAFEIGNRITIKNPTPPFGKKLTPGDRTGTITHVSPKKIFFNTDSGQQNRNRLKKNLTKIS